MAIEPDCELMLRVQEGDVGSFEVLLSRYRGPLMNYFTRLVQDSALAEDLAQEVFLRVYRARERYVPEARFSTWLYRIATNLGLNALRHRKGGGECRLADDGYAGDGEPREEQGIQLQDLRPTAEEGLIKADQGRLVRRAVAALPDKQRAAVILHKYHEVDYRQMTKILGCSESALKSLLFRAYETLRERLGPLRKEGQL